MSHLGRARLGSRMWAGARERGARWRIVAALFAVWLIADPGAASAAEPETCRAVRFSDVGWADVTASTAVVTHLLRNLGYEPQITVLSVPVTFASMKNRDIDAFLGNWMPAQAADRKPYDLDGSIAVVGPMLEGAKYTLATTDYAYDAGLRDFGDIQKFGDAMEHRIYGIEPGNDGNRLILELIQRNAFGLGGFQVIESSEQGMLAEVERATRARRPIVFLAWDPHPMNVRFHLKYLTGGDDVFGPNFGGATIYTLTRVNYTKECPNVAHLLANVKFTPKSLSYVMSDVLDRHLPADTAAANWLKANPDIVAGWLAGVTTFDGKPAESALRSVSTTHGVGAVEGWITGHKIPLGDGMTRVIDYIKAHFLGVFDGISFVIRGLVDGFTAALRAIPTLLLIALVAALAYVLRRSWWLATFVAAALLFILNQGYWQPTLQTLSLVMVSVFVATAIGVPLGIASAHRPRFYAGMRPVLDLMQTLPTFVYLIPTLVLFGLGVVPGVISTVIFALPAPIRLTQLGISSVPKALLEAGESFGATRLQMLVKVELPSAAPTIIAGITQCIMLSLSMVVIAALVGAGGLGVPVVRALNSVQIGMGFEAGFAIVLLAVILDRMTRPADKPESP